MNLTDVAGRVTGVLSSRFLLVAYLPVLAGALPLVVLVWAGAPGGTPDFSGAWETAGSLGIGESLVLVLALLVPAFLLQSLQLSLHTLWREGPPWRWWRRRRSAFWQGRREALAERARLPADFPSLGPAERDAATARAWPAASRLNRRFPPAGTPTRPTALGNLLTAMEHSAGRAHGWDAAVAWPRLYPVLRDPARSLVDDARDALDQAIGLATVMSLCAPLSLALLWPSGWWTLLTLVPAILAVGAYRAALRSAATYAVAVHGAFDLHRFDLLRALHLQLPADPAGERALAAALCDLWRQDFPLPPDTRYHHGEPIGGP
ncbi:hypothetical protein GCM10027160_24540 [Streptomyces calidiresistens]|uniref:Uncharacterized protein n=1 Tax=Streptomyces calidiresistens TaxID=1485586 RepID=A0A7W3XXG8_9ACTN|nr:hypothetical protein [Streptomyces calidiresistens]MBB0230888.1 hypothetical protein [Streptomyces calidiresistens]